MILKIIFLAVFHFLRIFEEKNRIFLKSMKNLEYNCSRHPDQKIILFGFFGPGGVNNCDQGWSYFLKKIAFS